MKRVFFPPCPFKHLWQPVRSDPCLFVLQPMLTALKKSYSGELPFCRVLHSFFEKEKSKGGERDTHSVHEWNHPAHTVLACGPLEPHPSGLNPNVSLPCFCLWVLPHLFFKFVRRFWKDFKRIFVQFLSALKLNFFKKVCFLKIQK